MKLDARVKNSRDRFVAKFPLPTKLSSESDDQWNARLLTTWTKPCVEQIAFDVPGEGYGLKRRSETAGISKDTLGQQRTPGGQFLVWDLLSGSGAGNPSLVPDPDSLDITADKPYLETRPEFFQPQNHVGNAPPVPVPVPPSSPVIPYDENKSIEFGLACNDVYRESGAAVDPGMIAVHSSRAAWDYYVGKLSWADSKKKHVNEFRAVYGLAPV